MTNQAFVVAIAMGILLLSSSASAVNTKVADVRCSSEKYQGGDAYANSVAIVLNDMMTTTANTPGKERITKAGNPGSQVFGRSTCQKSLSVDDCNSCLFVVESLIQGNCRKSFNAKLGTPDCTMAYGNSPV